MLQRNTHGFMNTQKEVWPGGKVRENFLAEVVLKLRSKRWVTLSRQRGTGKDTLWSLISISSFVSWRNWWRETFSLWPKEQFPTRLNSWLFFLRVCHEPSIVFSWNFSAKRVSCVSGIFMLLFLLRDFTSPQDSFGYAFYPYFKMQCMKYVKMGISV